jgi:hypothetical protein
VFKVRKDSKERHVALELSGIEGNYEYYIELVHDDPVKTLTFLKTVRFFDTTHPLKWRLLVNIKDLQEERFISGADKNSLSIRLFLRPSSIFEKCKIQEKYIQKLKSTENEAHQEHVQRPHVQRQQQSTEEIQICGKNSIDFKIMKTITFCDFFSAIT